jgi:hypothetical protein
MSGLNKVKQKTKEGAEWRGTITVDIDGESVPLTIRQLVDPEFEEVMGKINRDELSELREAYPSDAMQRLDELQSEDELTEEQETELSEVRDEIAESDVNVFDYLSSETFDGIRLAAIYGIEPDEEDKREALRERAHEIEKQYGVKVEQPDDTLPALQDDIEKMVHNSTDFLSFRMGMKVLTETVGDEGNSET